MSEMIERAAKAAYEKKMKAHRISIPREGIRQLEWHELPEDFKQTHEVDPMRAAIEAMREPTQEMVDAAWASALAEDACEVWRDMVDEALKPGEPIAPKSLETQ